MQGVQVQSLVGELRSHMPCGQKNQNIKQKQCCNKVNKDFKNRSYQKTFKKKKKKEKENSLCDPREAELDRIAATNKFSFLFYFLQLDSEKFPPLFQ